MSRKTIPLLMLSLLVWSCDVGPTDPAGGPEPGDALHAPGGGKGPPDKNKDGGGGSDGGDLTIEEFFVYQTEEGPRVHLVLSDVPDRMEAGGTLDHVGDGVRGYDPQEPSGAGAGASAESIDTLSDGRAHADILIPSDEFFDSPYFNLDGQGSDPWAISVRWHFDDGDLTSVAPRSPNGILADGVEAGSIEASGVEGAGHTDALEVRSWAEVNGTAVITGKTWVESVTTTVQCTETTVGKGRNREPGTEIDVGATTTFGNGMVDDYWYSVVLVDGAGAEIDRVEGPNPSVTLRGTVPGSPESIGDLRLLVDHVFPYFGTTGLVYDPLAGALSDATYHGGDVSRPFEGPVTTHGTGEHPVVVQQVTCSD